MWLPSCLSKMVFPRECGSPKERTSPCQRRRPRRRLRATVLLRSDCTAIYGVGTERTSQRVPLAGHSTQSLVGFDLFKLREEATKNTTRKRRKGVFGVSHGGELKDQSSEQRICSFKFSDGLSNSGWSLPSLYVSSWLRAWSVPKMYFFKFVSLFIGGSGVQCKICYDTSSSQVRRVPMHITQGAVHRPGTMKQ